MSYDPSVVIESSVAVVLTDLPYLNVMCLTFAPSTSAFKAGFEAGASFVDPTTNLGLGEELTVRNFESRLRAFGATPTEPVWQAVKGHFNPRATADAQGFRDRIKLPPRIFIAARTRAANSETTLDFTTNTTGFITITVNPSRNLFADGYLAQVVVEADGVKTAADLRDEAVAGLVAIPEFAALYLAAPGGGDDMTITDLAPDGGYPLVVKVEVTTGGPIITNTVTTANTPGDYALDLDDVKRVLELQDDPITGKPERRMFFISDLQGDKTVNAEGYEWAQDEREEQVPRDYEFHGFSLDPLNFDPLSAGTSEAEIAAAANGGTGWNYGSVCDHDLYEFPVPVLLGRTIGYLPGEISFTSKVLDGSVSEAKITPRDKADNASLAADRRFNYNSPDGPKGRWVWGYLSDGSFVDRDWLASYAKYVGEQAKLQFMALRNIVAFTNADIEAGASALRDGLLTIPALAQFPDLLTVTYKTRQELDSNSIAVREYVDYTVTAASGGVINRFGTIANPISVTISESLA